MGAVRAGHRGVFDDGDGRLLVAEDLVAKRAGLHQLGFGHALSERAMRKELEAARAGERGGEGERGGGEQELAAGRTQGKSPLVSGCSA